MPTPKVIHFVWAGGNKQLPGDNLRTLLEWKKANPQLAVCVWIDAASCRGGREKIERDYLENFKQLQRKHPGEFPGELHSYITLQDISTLETHPNYLNNPIFKQALDLARHEFEEFRANFGQSSDLLRYLILYFIGGAFFDSDILPGSKNLQEIFDHIEQNENLLYVDPHSQGGNQIGNDAFICAPNNPIMLNILKLAVSNCKEQPPQCNNAAGEEITASLYMDHFSSGRKHYARYEPNYFQQGTITRTGPEVVRQIVQDSTGTNAVNVVNMENDLRTIPGNQANWTKVFIHKPDNDVSLTADLIFYHIQESKAFFLADYLHCLKQNDPDAYEENKTSLFAALHDRIAALQMTENIEFWNNIDFIQLDYSERDVQDFFRHYLTPADYKKKSLLFPLFDSNISDEDFYRQLEAFEYQNLYILSYAEQDRDISRAQINFLEDCINHAEELLNSAHAPGTLNYQHLNEYVRLITSIEIKNEHHAIKERATNLMERISLLRLPQTPQISQNSAPNQTAGSDGNEPSCCQIM